jgi:tetratricopeptide (TPR) repeat protein
VNYLLGYWRPKQGDQAAATHYWEKALSQFPNHVYSLIALGGARFAQNDLAGAATYFNPAATADPSLWSPHEMLARVDVLTRLFPEAQREAELAMKLGNERARGTRLLLARALIAQNKRDEAITALQPLLDTRPPDALSAAAGQLLAEAAPGKAELAALPIDSRARSGASEPSSLLAPPLPPPATWIPPDVDQRVPPVENGVACHLDQILPAVQKKVIRFAQLLERFTATEDMQDIRVNEQGQPVAADSLKSNYLVSMKN